MELLLLMWLIVRKSSSPFWLYWDNPGQEMNGSLGKLKPTYLLLTWGTCNPGICSKAFRGTSSWSSRDAGVEFLLCHVCPTQHWASAFHPLVMRSKELWHRRQQTRGTLPVFHPRSCCQLTATPDESHLWPSLQEETRSVFTHGLRWFGVCWPCAHHQTLQGLEGAGI